MTRLKRSRRLTLTLMATASVNLVACDQRTPTPLTWEESGAAFETPAAAPVADAAESAPALAYDTVDACKAAGEVPAADCDAAWAAAQADHAANAPRFGDKAACEAEYGAGNCETRASSGGGSFFTPFLAGMLLGNMFGGNRGYAGTGYYRDRQGRLGTPYGGRGSLFRGPDGRMQVGRSAFSPAGVPPAVARAPAARVDDGRAVSRGGFRSTRSYAGRGYGG